MFITWQLTIGGRLKSDFRFSNTVVWNNLPLPTVDEDLRQRIIAAGQEIEVAPSQRPDRSIAQHYVAGAMTPELTQAHADLDALVDRAFGSDTSGNTERERQQILFARYDEISAGLLTSLAKAERGRS